MGFGVAVGDGVGDDDDVVAEVEGAARGGFDSGAGADAGDEDLSDVAAAEVSVEIGADERAVALC